EWSLEDFETGRAGDAFDLCPAPGVKDLAVQLGQPWLVVESVHRTGAAVHEQLHDASDFRPMVQAAVEFFSLSVIAGEKGFSSEQVSQRQRAEPAAPAGQHFSPRALANGRQVPTPHRRTPLQGTNMNSLVLNIVRQALAKPCCLA